jgi:hypothetical protein
MGVRDGVKNALHPIVIMFDIGAASDLGLVNIQRDDALCIGFRSIARLLQLATAVGADRKLSHF